MTSGSWPPDYRLPDYKGPYPVRELENARKILIARLTDSSVPLTVEKLKPIIGIDSAKFGKAIRPKPHPNEKVQGPQKSAKAKASASCSSASCSSADNLAAMNTEESVSKEYSNDIKSLSGQNQLPVPITHTTSKKGTGHHGDTIPLKREWTGLVEGETNHKRPKVVGKADVSSMSMVNDMKISSQSLMTKLYKCDFCPFQALSRTAVEKHLVETTHPSGSLYNALRRGETFKCINVERMLAVVNLQSKNSLLVIICPTCNFIFEDIFRCGMHHKHCHDGYGYYSICKVVKHTTILIPQNLACPTCDQTFETRRSLRRHWRAETEHHPFRPSSDRDVFHIFACPYCEKRSSHSTSYYQFEDHILRHKTYGRPYLAINVKYAELPRGKEEILPFNTDEGHQDGIQQQVEILKSCLKYAKRTSVNRKDWKSVKVTLKRLKSQLYTRKSKPVNNKSGKFTFRKSYH